jgi:hypothetical protein
MTQPKTARESRMKMMSQVRIIAPSPRLKSNAAGGYGRFSPYRYSDKRKAPQA